MMKSTGLRVVRIEKFWSLRQPFERRIPWVHICSRLGRLIQTAKEDPPGNWR